MSTPTASHPAHHPADSDGALSHRLEEQVRLLSRVIASVSDFAYAFDLDGRFIYVNKPLLDLWGLTLEQALGKNFFDLQYPADLAAKLQGQIQRVIDTGQRVVDETPYTSPQGVGGHYQYIFSPIFNAHGRVEAVAGTTREISDLKRAQAYGRFQLALTIAVRHLTDPAQISTTYARMLGELLSVNRCTYCEVNADEDGFTVNGEYVQGVQTLWGWRRFSEAGRDMLDMLRSDQPFSSSNVETLRLPAESQELLRGAEIGGLLCVPLHKSGRFAAAMMVHQKTPRQWLPEEVELLRDVGARCWESQERARVVRALRENEEFHRFAAEAGRTGSWYMKLDSSEWVLSPVMAEMMEFPPTQKMATRDQWFKRIVPRDRRAVEAAISTAIKRDAPLDMEFRISLRDGSERWLYCHGGIYRDAQGKAVRLHGACVDRTEHKRTEQRERAAAAEALAAAETNAKFRVFFEQGSQFAGVMALDGTLIAANRLSLEACGYQREEVVGKKFWECGWWNRSPVLIEMIQHATREAAAGRTFKQESLYFIADGSTRWVDLTLTPVRDDAGKVIFIAPTGQDITERRLLTEERERLLASERTARAQAEAASRAKDKFIAVLSHELRTPLSPVVMTLPLLENDPDMPPQFHEDLAMMRRNIALEVKLIDDLLDLSRVATGKLRLDLRRVSVHEVLRHAMQSTMFDLGGKRLNIQQDLAASEHQTQADAARLQQVFWNLLRNAVKFTPEGGTIRVRTWNSADSSDIVVEVEDTGIGIPGDSLGRIFDAFEQGDSRVTRQFGGLGLGLAIAKAVTEMHGGRISASSDGAGKGACFRIQLPVETAEPTMDGTANAHPFQAAGQG